MPVFSPPTVNDLPMILPTTRGIQYRSWRYYGSNPRGRSVLKTGGVYRTVDTPSVDEINAATEYYAGGHIYTISQAVADALTAAGYTVGADPTPPPRDLMWGFLVGLTWDEFRDQYGTWG